MKTGPGTMHALGARTSLRQAIFCTLALLATACGRPFDVATPHGFVELPEPGESYDYRAASPDGLVVAVRAVHEEGVADTDLQVWTRAVILAEKGNLGYALVEEKAVTSADGTHGKRLVFGHDEGGKPYLYAVTIFPAQGRLYVIEEGGSVEAVKAAGSVFEKFPATVMVRCRSFLAPVLASRTCNRW